MATRGGLNMTTRWLRISISDGSNHDMPLALGRTTVGGSSPHIEATTEHLDIDLEEFLPPGPQAALLVTDERVLAQSFGQTTIETESGETARGSQNIELLPGDSVYLGDVKLTVSVRKPETTVSRIVMCCVVLICVALVSAFVFWKKQQPRRLSPAEQLSALIEKRPTTPREHVAMVRRGLLAEESGDCELADAYYRKAWLAVDTKSPLRRMAQRGKSRCEPVLERLAVEERKRKKNRRRRRRS